MAICNMPEKLAKVGRVAHGLCERTDKQRNRQIDKQTYSSQYFVTTCDPVKKIRMRL